MSESKVDAYRGVAVGAILVGLIGSSLCGGAYAAFQQLQAPVDTHWTRELSEPQWREGGPTPEDLMKQNKPFDWNPPHAAETPQPDSSRNTGGSNGSSGTST